MQIQPISKNQQTFNAVNQKYFAWAKEDIRRGGNVSTEWLQRLGYDVYLFKKIPHKDAIDTIEEIKSVYGKITEGTKNLLEGLIKTNPNP